MSVSEFRVSGMTCAHCEMSVREEVGRVPGVDAVEVSAAAGRLVVTGTDAGAVVDDRLVLAAVEEAGYSAERVS
ncbi:heavy-metal-associated domain-containing protein [Paractinoplanes rhizophilus]|jgi:copper chaperone CopZ|uniref:Heavy-metal-associated domain-containing protein n=1 Tax=Paractinoplanes rhizophilus TaxID=1416877 RepID=A0ABW2I058_9ACTN|nr:heavy-metal-associated domain-containing protein [Actinoplanes sp.]